MKNYLITFAIWIILALVFTFFFAGMILNAGIYLVAVLIGFVAAVITCCFEKQAERIEELKKRLDTLERDRQ